MAEPLIAIACVSNVFTRRMYFRNAGDIEVGHAHQFDHVTYVASGAIELNIEGAKTVYKAPAMIFIDKDKVHELTALEDGTSALCIHALRDKETNEIIDPEMMPNYPDNAGVGDLIKRFDHEV